MEQQLLDKYGGRNINRRLLKDLIKDIKNYKEPKTIKAPEPNLYLDNVLTKIDTMKDGRGDDLSDSSKKNYKSKIKAIDKVIPNIFQLFIDNPNNNPIVNDAISQIVNKYPKSSKDYLAVISKVINNLEGLSQRISPYIKGRIQQAIKEGLKVSQKTSDEKVEFKPLKITWKEFTKKVKQITKDEKIPLQVKVLFELYKLLTLRDNFGNVRITDKDLDDDTNFYNFKTKIFHLNNYKTKKKYGNKKYELPVYLNKMIEKLYEQQNYLYVNLLPDTLYLRGELSGVIPGLTKKYFGVEFNITDMRNARVSYSQEKESIDKQRITADIMLHSLAVAQQQYNRKEK